MTALSALSAASTLAYTDKIYVVQNDGSGGLRATVSQLPGAYAGIYVSGGAATQTTNGSAGTFDKMTGFTTNGLSSNCTADAANDRIICTVAGKYYCGFNVSFSGTGSETYRCRLYNVTSAAAVAQGELERKLGTAGDVGSASFQCFFTAAANDEFIIQVACSSGNSKSFTPTYSNFTVQRVGP